MKGNGKRVSFVILLFILINCSFYFYSQCELVNNLSNNNNNNNNNKKIMKKMR